MISRFIIIYNISIVQYKWYCEGLGLLYSHIFLRTKVACLIRSDTHILKLKKQRIYIVNPYIYKQIIISTERDTS